MSMRDFRVVGQIGKGSYGKVYRVKRLKDGEDYAAKEVNVRRLSTREREDSVNEVRVLASIRSEYVIRYCAAFVEKDNLFVVMEYAPCGDVGRIISEHKAANKYVKEDTIWSLFIQMTLGLKALHSHGVLHRDLKPKNVFLSGKGDRVRLGDLGCARLIKNDFARTQVGTPYYMCPELWSHKPYDYKCDIWALGCIVFELAMLNPPFLAADMDSLARKVQRSDAPRVSRHYSKELQDVVARLITKSARARPTVDEILDMDDIKTRMHLVPPPETGRWRSTKRESHILATIKVPRQLGRLDVRLDLPEPCFPADRPRSSPSKLRGPTPSPIEPASARAVAVVASTEKASTAAAAPGGGTVEAPRPSARHAEPSERLKRLASKENAAALLRHAGGGCAHPYAYNRGRRVSVGGGGVRAPAPPPAPPLQPPQYGRRAYRGLL